MFFFQYYQIMKLAWGFWWWKKNLLFETLKLCLIPKFHFRTFHARKSINLYSSPILTIWPLSGAVGGSTSPQITLWRMLLGEFLRGWQVTWATTPYLQIIGIHWKSNVLKGIIESPMILEEGLSRQNRARKGSISVLNSHLDE